MPRSSAAEKHAPATEHYETDPEVESSATGEGGTEFFKKLTEAHDETAQAERHLHLVTDEMVAAAGADGLTANEQAANNRILDEGRIASDTEVAELAALGVTLSPIEGGPAKKSVSVSAVESQPQAARPEAAPEAKPEQSPLAERLASSGERLAQLEAQAAKSRRPDAELQASLEAARAEYQGLRIEYVGENVRKYVETQAQQIEARREALEKEKGLLRKGYDFYKKLGNLNLERLGWKPTSRIGKITAKLVSVRTGISLLLVGAGATFGAGTAVGVAAIGLRRLLCGVGTSIGTYDFLRSAQEAKLSAGFSVQQIETMEQGDVITRMEQIEANALTGGKSLKGNKAYQQLQGRLTELMEAEQVRVGQVNDLSPQEQLARNMAAADRGLGKRVTEARRTDRRHKVLAGAVGLTVGSGLLAKAFGNATHWLGITKKTAATVHEAAVVPPAGAVAEAGHEAVAAPSAVAGAAANEAAPPSPLDEARVEFRMTANGQVEAINAPPAEQFSEKMLEAGQVRAGDGYARIIVRDLSADPEKFGYDASRDGSVTAWARKLSGKIMRDNGLANGGREMRLRFDPSAKEPSRILLSLHDGQISVEKSNVREYVFSGHHSAPVAEAPEAVKPVMTSPEPASIDTEQIKVSGYYEQTGSHLQPTELGSTVIEFKPLDAQGLAQAKELVRPGFEGHLGKGVIKDRALLETVFKDRQRQLFALKKGYEQALAEGKAELAERLNGGYNVLARAANRDLADQAIFQELPPYHAPTGLEAVANQAASEAAAHPVEKAAAAQDIFGTSAGKLEFVRGEHNELVGVKLAPVDLNPAEKDRVVALLREDWANHLKNSSPLTRSSAQGSVRTLYGFKKALVELAKKPGVDPEELKFLKKEVARITADTTKRFGDILAEKA